MFPWPARAVSSRSVARSGRLSRFSTKLLTEIHNVHIRPEADVISQIPARVIGIVVNDDLVGIPQPTVAIANIKGSNAPEPTVETETRGTAASETPNMAATNAAIETTVLPGMVEMIIGIVATGIMTHPLAIVVNVRSFRMALFVGMARLRSRMAFTTARGWPSLRDESAAYFVSATTAAMMFITVLGRQDRDRRHRQTCHR